MSCLLKNDTVYGGFFSPLSSFRKMCNWLRVLKLTSSLLFSSWGKTLRSDARDFPIPQGALPMKTWLVSRAFFASSIKSTCPFRTS